MSKAQKLFLTLAMVVLSFSLQACATQSQQSQLLAGETAFKRQSYHDAFQQLMPLAKKGNADAQYAVGYMYYYGEGVAQDTHLARKWLQDSAKQGNPLAKQALRDLYRNSQPGNPALAVPMGHSGHRTQPYANSSDGTHAAGSAGDAKPAVENPVTPLPNYPQ